MGVYKDDKTGKWYVKTYYTDWTGKKKQKMKRGFLLQRDAKEWERKFLDQQQGNPAMSFEAMTELFLEDKKAHSKLSSYKSEKQRLDIWVTPYFKNKPINEITPSDVRKWQTKLKTSIGANGKLLSPSYMRNIVTELSAVFNFAMKYYGLAANPCRIAGDNVGKKVKSCRFWTKNQFDKFISTFEKTDPFYTAFMVLYYTGMRIGELMALTVNDIDLDAGTIEINKTYHVIDGEAVVTPPKTARSNRTIFIPPTLCKCLETYMDRIYKATGDARIFQAGKDTYLRHLKKHEELAGLEHIRLHDIRHSHASLLIELGCSALLVSERLGHENVSTTLDIYSHLFPSKQSEIADKLEDFCFVVSK